MWRHSASPWQGQQHTQRQSCPAVTCMCLHCGGRRHTRNTKLPWTAEKKKKNPFISKQDSFKTTLQEQTPKTVLKNYVNCTIQGCQGTLYHPSPECALWSLVFQWSQGAQIMIKDFHLWPWDVKSPVHSYDLRRTNCKVIIAGASFKASQPQW